MKILCLIDSQIQPGDRWIWDCLPGNRDEIDFLVTCAADRFPRWGKVLAYYPSYLGLALRAYRQTQREKYDLVVAWEGKNGFPYAAVRRITNQSGPPLVILSFTYRGILRRFPWLARTVLGAADHITVTTRFELEEYPKALGIEPCRISLVRIGWYDGQNFPPGPAVPKEEPFILAAGRSYRDYETLARAVEGLKTRVVIVARKFNLSGIRLPDNVETLDFMNMCDFWRLLQRAAMLVVPLQPQPHSAGDCSFVHAMSAGKAVIGSDGPSARTYVKHGLTGLRVPPKDPSALRSAIQYLLEHPDETRQMGLNARQRFENEFTFEDMARNIQQTLERSADEYHR